MQFGAHLPLMDFGGNPFTHRHLVAYTAAASELGFGALSVNDHLVFAAPWLDGPTALAAVMEHSGEMTLATTVALPVLRGPVALAKALAAIDRLSNGRLRVAVGPGSSPDDYAAAGIDFAERWPRFDESVAALRSLLGTVGAPHVGRFYSTEGISLLPGAMQAAGPPIWVGSWGSDAGLRRVARLADGWLASAYNTTHELFASSRRTLGEYLAGNGKDTETFPNALATMWCYITDDRAEAERVLRERVRPIVHASQETLRERLPIGPAELFAENLTAFATAGVNEVFIWPVADEVNQLHRFADEVRPVIVDA
jgi:alkanesulfonate monooxygenase SsuD/methylene tetrahydromethanopterin reductase-like flavin-dependent oxidoreductase (luciferase family)